MSRTEFQFQTAYTQWDARVFPDVVGCSTPEMNHKTAPKSKRKGYMSGYPDWVSIDPRVSVEWEGDRVYLRFYPMRIYEFKRENGKGSLSEEQKRVLKNVRNRGCYAHAIDNMEDAQKKAVAYHQHYPLYKGRIMIDTAKKTVHLPRVRKQLTLPGRGPKKQRIRKPKKTRRKRKRRR